MISMTPTRDFSLILLLVVIFVPPAWSASVQQRTEGPCSPALADVKGNVNITCEGIDPALQDEIIKILNEILRDTRKIEKIRRDLEKSSKRTDAIEERLADRKLTDAQVAIIADSVKQFPGQEFKLTAYWHMKEPMALHNRILDALTIAGWKHIKHERGSMLLGGVEGVLVYVNNRAPAPTIEAGVALINVLRRQGIVTEAILEEAPTNPHNLIQINIGTKP